MSCTRSSKRPRGPAENRRRTKVPRLLSFVAAVAQITCAAGICVAEAPASQIVATLDGEPIELSEVSAEVGFQVYRLKVDIYTLLRRATEDLVDRRLLEREAAARGVSVEALVAAETATKVTAVREADVDAYVEEHPDAAAQPGARERIRHYLHETRKIEQRLALLAELRRKADYVIHLAPPVQPRVSIDVSGAPVRGPEVARVLLVHFGSFTSPRSLRAVEYLRRLVGEFPADLRWVHRHLPREYDEASLASAQLAVAAETAGRFWEVHDSLFALEGRLSHTALEDVARDHELSLPRPGDTVHLDRIKADAEAASRAGIEHDGVIFVNGRYFDATFPYQKLQAMVAEELSARSATGARDAR